MPSRATDHASPQRSSAAVVRGAAHPRGIVAVITHRKSSVEEAVLIAQAFDRDGRLHAKIITHLDHVATTIRQRDPSLAVATLDGRPYPQPADPATAASKPTVAALPRATIRIRNAVRNTVLGETAFALRQAALFRAAARRLIAAQPIAAVITFDDRAFAPDAHVLDIAARAGIPRVMGTYASSTVESSIWLRKGQRDFDLSAAGRKLSKQIAACLLPHSTRREGDSTLLFYRAETTLALALGRTHIPRPWVYGGNIVDKVFVFGEQDRDERIADGVPPERIVVAGQPSLDILHAASRDRVATKRELRAKYKLTSAPVAVLAIPPMAEHSVIPWPKHLDDTRFVAQTLVNKGFQIAISLHPRSTAEPYGDIIKDHSAVVLQERLSTSLPIADLFVSGYSSTVRWAALLAIPTVVYDFLLDWRMFDGLEGLEIARCRDELSQALHRLSTSEARCERSTLMTKQAARIAILDGHAAQRIVDTVFELTLPRAGAAAAKGPK